MVRLPDSVKILKIRLLVLTEFTNVTDRETDRQTDRQTERQTDRQIDGRTPHHSIGHACIALRGRNDSLRRSPQPKRRHCKGNRDSIRYNVILMFSNHNNKNSICSTCVQLHLHNKMMVYHVLQTRVKHLTCCFWA